MSTEWIKLYDQSVPNTCVADSVIDALEQMNIPVSAVKQKALKEQISALHRSPERTTTNEGSDSFRVDSLNRGMQTTAQANGFNAYVIEIINQEINP